MVTFPRPSAEVLQDFIIQTNGIDHVPLTMTEIKETLTRAQLHPLVAGHLSAFDYGIKRLSSDFKWPVHDPAQCQTPLDSDTHLYWLRELHKKLSTPLATYGQDAKSNTYLSPADCGTYRLGHYTVGLDRHCPKPTSILPLLHNWLNNIASFHLSVAGKLNSPTDDLLDRCFKMAWTAHLQLVCIHPFPALTGRTARLVENLLRLRWGLPWRTIKQEHVLQYVHDIATYEDGDEWQAILEQHDAKWRKRAKTQDDVRPRPT